MKNEKKDPALVMPTPAEVGGAQQYTQLEKIFTDSIKDIYWAETALTKALPKMKAAVTTAELKMAIAEHLTQTENHVKRLEQVFELLGTKAEAKKCAAMEGLLKEGDEIIASTEEGTMTRDAAVIMAAQKVEHYEIATYGSLVEIARTLGIKEAVGLLDATLDEEKQADQGLTLLARTGINWTAEHEPVSEESETFQ